MAASPVQPSKSLYSGGIRLGPDVSPFPTPPPKKVLPGFPNWKQPTSQHGTHASSSHNYVVLMEEEKLCFEGRLRNLHSTCKRTVFVQETESSHHIQQRAPLFPCIEGGGRSLIRVVWQKIKRGKSMRTEFGGRSLPSTQPKIDNRQQLHPRDTFSMVAGLFSGPLKETSRSGCISSLLESRR